MIKRLAYSFAIAFIMIVVSTGVASDFFKPYKNVSYDGSSSVWIKITKTFSDFSTAGLSSTVTIYTLPAKCVILSVMMKHNTAFAGGSIATYTVSVGRTGVLQDFITNSNVKQAPSSTLSFKPLTAMIPTVYDFSATTDVVASAISTIGNLNTATAGSLDIYLEISTLQ
jgi:hypothetical protein